MLAALILGSLTLAAIHDALTFVSGKKRRK